jgi:hypothetical protein
MIRRFFMIVIVATCIGMWLHNIWPALAFLFGLELWAELR